MNIFSECTSPSAKKYKDGVCDEANNVESCNYDGGDCCDPDSNYSLDFAPICLAIEVTACCIDPDDPRSPFYL